MIKKIYEMTSQEITDFINNLLPVKKIEKDTFGEVFTNPVLINKLLDLFPSIIWNDPFKKWLDHGEFKCQVQHDDKLVAK